MKKLVFILAIALVLIGVIAAPAMADKPLLTFETALADDLGERERDTRRRILW
jgi:hypothetical protein